MRMITNVTFPTNGAIYYDGIDIHKMEKNIETYSVFYYKTLGIIATLLCKRLFRTYSFRYEASCGYPTAQQNTLAKYAEVNMPFYLHAGITRNAFDYINFYILFLAIMCTTIAAPIFAKEYQTGSDNILRATNILSPPYKVAALIFQRRCFLYAQKHLIPKSAVQRKHRH